MTRILRVLLGLFFVPALAMAQGADERIVLQPGDAIQLKILREPGLSGDFFVNDRGEAVLPIIGTRRVAGQSWGVVRDSLRQAFARELRNPDIGLVPLRRTFVMGMVAKPGVYYLDPLGTIAQAVAFAGGIVADGDPSRIRIVRAGVTVIPRIALDAPMQAAEVQSGDQILVERRGWFDRNSAAVIGAGAGLLGVIATLVLIR